jgi:hypothetical protein
MLLKQDQALNQDSYYEAGVRRPAASPRSKGASTPTCAWSAPA